MQILSFSKHIFFLLLISVVSLSVVSCKDDDDPCQAGDPAIVGAECNDGFVTNNTTSSACANRGGVDHWVCDPAELGPAVISGTITFENVDTWATWQDSGEVQVTLFPAFSLNPPAGWGDIPVNALYPGFPGGRFALGAPYNAQDPVILTYVPGQTQYNYSIEVDPGTYSALAVGFRHDFITDPSKRTATLGVYWNNANVVSNGLVLKVDIGGGQIITIYDDPAPSVITVEAGDELDLDFRADFGFVEEWF